MPTQTKVMTGAFVAVAQGPGTYYVQFQDDKGEFLIHGSATPSTGRGLTLLPGQLQAVVLAASTDFLQCRGRGDVQVAGTTLL